MFAHPFRSAWLVLFWLADRAMAANLSPEFLAGEREYQSARTYAERVAALERMVATVGKKLRVHLYLWFYVVP
jgi:hypothetical protein